VTGNAADLVKWAERVQALYDEHKRRRGQAASLASLAARRRAGTPPRSPRKAALRALLPGRTEVW